MKAAHVVLFAVVGALGSAVAVASLVGFPFGAGTTDVKAMETRRAVRDGAREIDMVINIGAIKSKDYALVEQDIRGVVQAAGRDTVVKVILETSLLTREEKIKRLEEYKEYLDQEAAGVTERIEELKKEKA